jgi:hypothetical protein
MVSERDPEMNISINDINMRGPTVHINKYFEDFKHNIQVISISISQMRDIHTEGSSLPAKKFMTIIILTGHIRSKVS